jgi:hypothetical protein
LELAYSAKKHHSDQGDGKETFSISQRDLTSVRPARRMKGEAVISG